MLVNNVNYNIVIVTLQKNGQEAAVIQSPPETLQSIGNLLGGPPEKYELSITNKITVWMCMYVII